MKIHYLKYLILLAPICIAGYTASAETVTSTESVTSTQTVTGAGSVTSTQTVTSTQPVKGEEITITLEELDAIKSQEKRGDELYFSITEYPSTSPAKHYQVPSFPSHWVSAYFKSLKNIVLWQKDMSTCEPMEVIFSLVEEDLPPWIPDDLLGSAKLKIHCENGKAIKEWVVPNKEITNEDTVNDKKTVFNFTGKGADYRAVLYFDEKPIENGKNVDNKKEEVKK